LTFVFRPDGAKVFVVRQNWVSAMAFADWSIAAEQFEQQARWQLRLAKIPHQSAVDFHLNSGLPVERTLSLAQRA